MPHDRRIQNYRVRENFFGGHGIDDFLHFAFDSHVALLVDDLVMDKTRALAFEVIAKAKERMMGWDMRSGLETATGAHICVIDGDGQMPSTDIVKVYRLLQVGGYDLVKTFRSKRDDGQTHFPGLQFFVQCPLSTAGSFHRHKLQAENHDPCRPPENEIGFLGLVYRRRDNDRSHKSQDQGRRGLDGIFCEREESFICAALSDSGIFEKFDLLPHLPF